MNDNKKKNSGKSSKMIRNDMQDIRNIERITTKEKLRLRCKCQHVDEQFKPAVFRADGQKSDVTGHPLFVCRLCGAYLDLQEITEDDLNNAMDVMCRASEVIKLRLRPDKSEGDRSSLKKVWKFEYFMKSQFADLFKSARHRQNSRRSNSGGDGFISGRPMSHS